MFFLADLFERKKLLLATYIGFIIGTAACGFANSYNLLLIARIVAGILVVLSVGKCWLLSEICLATNEEELLWELL
jgi:predicted MFS family arabinose efflux permease